MRIAILALLRAASVAQAESISGQIIAISYGDRLTLLDDTHQRFKIRLAGIDAPESRQAFGQAAKRHLSDLAYRMR